MGKGCRNFTDSGAKHPEPMHRTHKRRGPGLLMGEEQMGEMGPFLGVGVANSRGFGWPWSPTAVNWGKLESEEICVRKKTPKKSINENCNLQIDKLPPQITWEGCRVIRTIFCPSPICQVIWALFPVPLRAVSFSPPGGGEGGGGSSKIQSVLLEKPASHYPQAGEGGQPLWNPREK